MRGEEPCTRSKLSGTFACVGWLDVAPSDEVTFADWIRDRLHPFAKDVSSVVPTGFSAYARIFHPAWLRMTDLSSRPAEVRWSEVAKWNGKTVHPEMQFHAIGGPWQNQPQGLGPPIYEPHLGVLPEGQSSELATLLASHTTTPGTCWMCLWEGYGYVTGAVASLTAWHQSVPWWRRNKLPGIGFGRVRLALPRRHRPPFPNRKRVSLPHRDYLLFKGSVHDAQSWEDGPNLWWPGDRAWCVASEIDFQYTYVGGSSELIEKIVRHPAFEALPATPADGITADSDRINS